MSSPAILVVDLQTGLLRTDLAREAFWRALSTGGWRKLGDAGRGGGGAFAAADSAELRALPFIDDVVEDLRRRRAEGGRVALVTDAPQEVAARFAEALDMVDEAVGGVPAGEERAGWLARTYGEFDYIADRPAPKRSARAYVKALRPHQWVKNLLVFVPMIAAHQLDLRTFSLSLAAFAAFSVVASSVYIFNDLLDLSADRAHPRKRRRPMASGAVPLDHAAAMAIACLALGFLIAMFAGGAFVAALAAYTLLTTAYSLRLKREPVIDVCVLATLYTMRMVAGAAATGIVLSVWLLAFAIFIFLSLAAVKRQAELVDNIQSGKEKPAGRGYRVGDLPIVEMMGVTAGYVAVLVLALYLNTPTVVALYETPQFLWAVCAVLLYWISRAAMIAHRGEMDDDPIVFAFRDRVSQVCGVCVVLALAAATWS